MFLSFMLSPIVVWTFEIRIESPISTCCVAVLFRRVWNVKRKAQSEGRLSHRWILLIGRFFDRVMTRYAPHLIDPIYITHQFIERKNHQKHRVHALEMRFHFVFFFYLCWYIYLFFGYIYNIKLQLSKFNSILNLFENDAITCADMNLVSCMYFLL